MSESIVNEFDSFYFVGIGGVSMSAIAKILFSLGKSIGGCDRNNSYYTEELSSMGIPVAIGACAALENYQVVAYTDAIPDNDASLIKARKMNKYLVPRGILLDEICKLFKNTVAVAGCHGKTTGASMIAHIFKAADLNFSAHIGGSDLTFSNAHFGGSDYFITEACEYKRNFLYLKPDVAVILNSDADHLDCYGSAENLKKAYDCFSDRAGKCVRLFGDSERGGEVTFGFDDRADFFAKRIRSVCGVYHFTAYGYGRLLGEVKLSVYGKHNVLNALAAIAVSRICGIRFDSIAQGLSSFTGVKRRFEKIGTIHGAMCICDYAHHPNEIKAALKTVRQVTEGELYVVFQPHTYSRTKTLFKSFVSVLSSVKRLMVYKTFAAREYYDDAGSALTLSCAIKHSHYGSEPADIANFTLHAGMGDTIIFLGAGDIYEVAETLVD